MEWNVNITRKEDFDHPVVRIAGAIFLIIGVIFVIIALASSLGGRSKTYEKTTAVITGFDRDGYPYVASQVDGKEYESRLNFQSSGMRMGDRISVRYEPDAPHRVSSVKGNAVFGYIFGGVGGFTGAIGLALLIMARKAKKRKAAQETPWEPV